MATLIYDGERIDVSEAAASWIAACVVHPTTHDAGARLIGLSSDTGVRVFAVGPGIPLSLELGAELPRVLESIVDVI